ncbi:glycosyltransferase family 4 protein [Butyrivibrio sp. JL13D10]|uniref:glycosyltransferase family 4 protein n=1 Tax=Butyrivibrio sp. JL13D10 TaxID=3236815 RepID=UPI0038B47ED7
MGFCKGHPLIINGRIFTQKITGVQRYGIEIVRQIDRLVEPGEVILAIPQRALTCDVEFSNIETVVVGKRRGNLWTQTDLPLFAYRQKGTILSLAGIAPILKPDFVTAHDISFIRYPRSYKKMFRWMYRIGYRLTLQRARRIITVSEFSRNELMDYYRLKEDRFIIAGNAADHLLRYEKDRNLDAEKSVLNAFNIHKDEKYYLTVGSSNIHKNQDFIMKLAARYPDRKFVIAGGSSAGSFNNKKDAHCVSKKNAVMATNSRTNLIFTGYVTDNELSNLYKNAYAFIFPSLYEGFGIPPLEAIYMGVRHIALADIPALKEIYPVGCYFFDPGDVSKFDMEALDYNGDGDVEAHDGKGSGDIESSDGKGSGDIKPPDGKVSGEIKVYGDKVSGNIDSLEDKGSDDKQTLDEKGERKMNNPDVNSLSKNERENKYLDTTKKDYYLNKYTWEKSASAIIDSIR